MGTAIQPKTPRRRARPQFVEERIAMVAEPANRGQEAMRAGHRLGTAVHRDIGGPGSPKLTDFKAMGLLDAASSRFRFVARLRDETRSASTRSKGHAGGRDVTAYGARPEGSVSKLSTYRDGWRIMRTILHLFRIERPVLFYGGFAAFLAALALVLALPLIVTYAETGLVPRFPTAILVTGLMVVAFLSFGVGLILDTVVRGRREVRRLAYLSFPAVGEEILRK